MYDTFKIRTLYFQNFAMQRAYEIAFIVKFTTTLSRRYHQHTSLPSTSLFDSLIICLIQHAKKTSVT